MTKKQFIEFSKKVIIAVMIMWFVGAVYGIIMCIVETYIAIATIDYVGVCYETHLPQLLTYIGAPAAGGLITYMAKSAFENRAKIEKGRMNYDRYNSDNFNSDSGC